MVRLTMTFQAVEIIQGKYERGLLLVADHAMRHLPDEYGQLGLPKSEFDRHIAYDIGVEGVTRHLAQMLDVPAVMARYSRLLIDPNRGMDDPTLVRQIYDGSVIRANYPLSHEERESRVAHYYRPFRDAVRDCAAKCEGDGSTACFIVSVHSFTPVMGAKARPWHIGLLWDKDDRATTRLAKLLSEDADLCIGDNEPYDGALKGDTMHEEGTKAGRAHVLIEIRQDLIESERGQLEWAQRLAPMLSQINAEPDMHIFRQFGSRTD
jgi:predicted N-formylglutamate amidohydrolase